MKEKLYPVQEYLEVLVNRFGARPLGSPSNGMALDWIESLVREWGYTTESLEFSCPLWNSGYSSLEIRGREYQIFPGPFSHSLTGHADIVPVCSVEQLKELEFENAVLVFYGSLAEEPLMPKNFPFYFPDHHREIYSLIERGKAAGVIAVTGHHPLSGEDPFPLFEDHNFEVPNAYVDRSILPDLMKLSGRANISIQSGRSEGSSRQPVFSNTASAPRVVVCAHIDTKYGTPGALDNAAGVAVLLEMMKKLNTLSRVIPLHFVPFNSEEYCNTGEVLYLDYLKTFSSLPELIINIDGPGMKNSSVGFSTYNMEKVLAEKIESIITKSDCAVAGEQWVAGDHSIFMQYALPSIAVLSSDFFNEKRNVSHTERDTCDIIDSEVLNETAGLICEIILKLF